MMPTSIQSLASSILSELMHPRPPAGVHRCPRLGKASAIPCSCAAQSGHTPRKIICNLRTAKPRRSGVGRTKREAALAARSNVPSRSASIAHHVLMMLADIGVVSFGATVDGYLHDLAEVAQFAQSIVDTRAANLRQAADGTLRKPAPRSGGRARLAELPRSRGAAQSTAIGGDASAGAEFPGLIFPVGAI